jgi:phage anti-repressor protein
MDLFKARDLKHQFLEVFKHTEDPFDNIIQSVEFVEDEHLIETKPAVEFF